MFKLPKDLSNLYLEIKDNIRNNLEEFKSVPEENYFYELVYCLCTPMSKAENAIKVQKYFQENNFLQNPFDPLPVLSNPAHYIRFHNQKSKYIQNAYQNFTKISEIINSNHTAIKKRELLVNNFKGIGFKEASHFLRNIGIFGLAILDRHILRNLVKFEQLPEKYSISSKKNYENIEKIFVNLSKSINLEVEEFDLLLWANETGYILK